MNFPRHSRALAAAMFALPLSTAVFAQAVTVTDIAVTGADGMTLTVPSIEATGSNLDEAGIRALFGTDYASTFNALATLDAASLKIPTLTMTYTVPGSGAAGQPTTIIYSDFEMTDVVDGVARGGARLGNVEVVGNGMGDTDSFVVGEMTASLLDLGGLIGFYGLAGDRPATTAMTPLYRDFTIAGMEITAPGVACTVGPATAAEFSARPLKYSFAEMMQRTEELETASAGSSEPSPETVVWLVNFYADFLTAFSSSPSIMQGMNCTIEDPMQNRTIAFSSGDLEVGGFSPGIYPSIAFNDFSFEVPSEGFFKFGNFNWKKTDFNAPIAAVLAAGDSIDLAWFETNWRKLIPALEGISFDDVSFDLPDEQNKGQRVVGSLEAFDITLADYVNGIPSDIATTTRGLSVALPPDNEAAPVLAMLGIDRLNLGFNLGLDWDEATRTIAVDNLSLSGAGLGTVSMRGTIAHASPELFDENIDVATAAAMALTVTEATIDIENGGITPALIAVAAAEQKLAPETFHLQLVAMSRALPMGVLGATEEALKVGEALGGFFEGAPKLTLTLTSVDPNGVGLAEFLAAQQNPEALKGKFTIVAEAAGEKVPFVFPTIAAPAAEPTPEVAPPAPAAPSDAPAGSSREDEKASSKN